MKIILAYVYWIRVFANNIIDIDELWCQIKGKERHNYGLYIFLSRGQIFHKVVGLWHSRFVWVGNIERVCRNEICYNSLYMITQIFLGSMDLGVKRSPKLSGPRLRSIPGWMTSRKIFTGWPQRCLCKNTTLLINLSG